MMSKTKSLLYIYYEPDTIRKKNDFAETKLNKIRIGREPWPLLRVRGLKLVLRLVLKLSCCTLTIGAMSCPYRICIFQETDKGLLMLNVTWKGKTYMGTLLDCHIPLEEHKWGPPG